LLRAERDGDTGNQDDAGCLTTSEGGKSFTNSSAAFSFFDWSASVLACFGADETASQTLALQSNRSG